MALKQEPWYIHAALYAVIAVLIYILLQVAIINPQNVIEQEEYYKTESRLRMKNIKEAQILYGKKYNKFTGSLDTLVNFIKNDPYVKQVRNGVDTVTNRPTDPFVNLTTGEFTPDSLFKTPRSQQRFILQVDSSTTQDTIINRAGKVLRVETNTKVGTRYFIEDPDGYGSIGSLESDALRNTASWE